MPRMRRRRTAVPALACLLLMSEMAAAPLRVCHAYAEDVWAHNQECLQWLAPEASVTLRMLSASAADPVAQSSVPESTTVCIASHRVEDTPRVGTLMLDATGDMYCSVGSSAEAGARVAHVSPDCDVWWHEQAFNALPLPLMAYLSLGKPGGARVTTPASERASALFGICKASATSSVLGIVHGGGTHYASCFLSDGRQLPGGYVLLGAVNRSNPYAVPPPSDDDAPALRASTLRRIESLVREHISHDDEDLFQRVTGSPFAALMDAIRADPPLRFLSADRWVHHAANKEGMHLLRCVLAERVTNARRTSLGYNGTSHQDYEALMRDGVIVRDYSTMDDEQLRGLLRMVSGYQDDDIPALVWTQRAVEGDPLDNNLDLHVDTFHPSWKVWLYAEDIESDHGPLTYVNQSHTNSEAKLRWLYRASTDPPRRGAASYGSFRMGQYGSVRSDEEAAVAAASPPPPYVMDANGVWRCTGCVDDERTYGLPPRYGVTAPKLSLVVADVSGLHARGLSARGKIRRTFILHGHGNDGGLPRRNPFTYGDGDDAVGMSNTSPLSAADAAVSAAGTVATPPLPRHLHGGGRWASEPAPTLAHASAVHRLPLYAPPLGTFRDMLVSALEPHYASVQADVVESPDFTSADWGLAAPGISGNNRIVDVGGGHHQLTPRAESLQWDLSTVATLAELGGASFIGAAGISRTLVGCNGEMMPAEHLATRARASKWAVAEHWGSRGVTVRPYNSSVVGFLANLMASDGAPGQVVRVRVARRTDRAECGSFTDIMRRGLAAQVAPSDVMGVGGVFRVVAGKVRAHVMRDTGGRHLRHQGEVLPYLPFFDMGPGLVAMTTFVTSDPTAARGSALPPLRLRLEHTHFFHPTDASQGGHYHGDITPDDVEYEAYLVPNGALYKIDLRDGGAAA